MNKEALHLINCKVGQKIREARLLRNLSQEKLSKQLGITYQQLQKYEKGDNRISASRLYHLASILDRPVSYFFVEPSTENSDAPSKGLLRWVALYNRIPKNIRINYIKMAENLVQKSEKEPS